MIAGVYRDGLEDCKRVEMTTGSRCGHAVKWLTVHEHDLRSERSIEYLFNDMNGFYPDNTYSCDAIVHTVNGEANQMHFNEDSTDDYEVFKDIMSITFYRPFRGPTAMRWLVACRDNFWRCN